MNVKSEINIIQKQLLERLNVRKGTTLFTIIQEISRQAFATGSFVVSQKNATLAEKCKVTTSTISRNLKKLKDKCVDLITIEQNRNVEEKFAALVFTFNCKENLQLPTSENSEVECEDVSDFGDMTNGTSNGCQSKLVNTDNECSQMAEITSSITTEDQVLINKNNNNLIHNSVNKDVDNQKTINEVYLEFASKGIGKTLFFKVLEEIKQNRRIKNFKAYLRGALNKVIYHLEFRKGNIQFNTGEVPFYNWLIE